MRTGLQFFGLSLSQSAEDHSNDKLPDLAVGSKGAVILLRYSGISVLCVSFFAGFRTVFKSQNPSATVM